MAIPTWLRALSDYDYGDITGGTYVPENELPQNSPEWIQQQEDEAEAELEARQTGTPTAYSPTPVYPTGGGQQTTIGGPTTTQGGGNPVMGNTWVGDDGWEYSFDLTTQKPVRTGRYFEDRDIVGKATKEAAERQRLIAEAEIRQRAEAERMRVEESRQQRLAELRANPTSWLEYHSLAKETPAIQPWMIPLMPQQYSQFKAGESLPGWAAGGSSLSGLPDLTDPSAQYMARLNPAQRQQYYGYERARTGARPEDTENVLWNQAPPSGTNQGLRWMR